MTFFPLGAERDPIEVMGEIVDGFSEYVDRAEEQVLQGRQYRLSLLWVHAVAALLMAPAFASLGQDGMAGNAWMHLRHIPGAPITIAIPLLIGGAILGVGCIQRNRKVEAVGLVFLAIFYVTIAVGFFAANMTWIFGDVKGIKPAPYTPVLYAHMSIIMIVHFRTLLRLLRKDAQDAHDAQDTRDAGGHL